MGSKVTVFVGLFLAMVLLISSQVAAKELAETSNTFKTSSKEAEKKGGAAAVDDAKYPGSGNADYAGGGYHRGAGYGGELPGRQGGGQGGGCHGGSCGGQGGGCHGGSCGGGGGGYCSYGCCRCCAYAGEKPEAETQSKPQN